MSSIANFYAGRDVFITGATGFLGKVLVEKLLRSASEIRNLYLLIRPQNGLDAKQRLEKIILSSVFDRVRKDSPASFQKLIPINGNVMEAGLGMSEEDTQTVCHSVSVLFHCAATIKFDEVLRISVEMNVIGTQRIVELAHKMDNIAAVVHASTAYANCDRTHVVESVYPPPIQPQKLISSLEWMNEEMIAAVTPHLLGKRPNTYTFTKALAEYLLVEEAADLPVIIVRPSIIGACWKEPFNGWIDNLNGPTGLMIAVGKGLLHTMHGEPQAKSDIVPVDGVSNVMIAAAWHRAQIKREEIPVINYCSGRLNPLTWGKVLDSFRFFNKSPMEGVYRVPSWHLTPSRTVRDVLIFLNHLVPAYIADVCCRIMGKRPRMVRIYGKLMKAVTTLEYFTTHDWEFQSKSACQLWEILSPEDKKTFSFDVRQIDWDRYLEAYLIGIKRFILKEDMANSTKARQHYNRLHLWTSVLNLTAVVVVIRVLVRKSSIFRSLWYFAMAAAARLYSLISRPGGFLGQP